MLASSRVRGALLLVLTLFAMTVAGCARQPQSTVPGAPGFLMGFVHGFTILFSLIGHLFTDVRIYAYPNTGGWYDFGYFLGACAFLGGSGASRRAR